MVQLTLNYTLAPEGDGRRLQATFFKQAFGDVAEVLGYLDESCEFLGHRVATHIRRGLRAGFLEKKGVTLAWTLWLPRHMRRRS